MLYKPCDYCTGLMQSLITTVHCGLGIVILDKWKRNRKGMSLNNFSYAVIGVLLGLLVLALGQLFDCQNLAGATMALQCPNGPPISKLWVIASMLIAGSGIAAWLYRNRNF